MGRQGEAGASPKELADQDWSRSGPTTITNRRRTMQRWRVSNLAALVAKRQIVGRLPPPREGGPEAGWQGETTTFPRWNKFFQGLVLDTGPGSRVNRAEIRDQAGPRSIETPAGSRRRGRSCSANDAEVLDLRFPLCGNRGCPCPRSVGLDDHVSPRECRLPNRTAGPVQDSVGDDPASRLRPHS